MYEAFYGFREKPFNLTPDPKYLYLSRRHTEAVAHLEFGRQEKGGFILITGEVGTGKTTLARYFLSRLDARTATAFVLYPALSAAELLRSILEDLHVAVTGASLKDHVDALHRFLLDARAQGRDVVLLIDEAQDLSPEVLEQIRLLSNLETDTEKLIQIVLMGQSELKDLLARHELRQLAQRVTARYHLAALTASETEDYVRHRLTVAGGEGKVAFTASALAAVHRLSHGIPRLINLVCDRALLAGFVAGARIVDAVMVHRAAREVKGDDGPAARRWPAVAAAVGFVAVAAFAVWRGVPARAGSATGATGATGASMAGPTVVPIATPVPAATPAADSAGLLTALLLALPHEGSFQSAVAQVEGLWGEARLQRTVLRTHMDQVRKLDLPVVLEMFHPARSDTCFLALVRIEGPYGIVSSSTGDTLRIPLADVDRGWTRQAVFLWKDYDAVTDAPDPGRKAAWARQNLSRLGYLEDQLDLPGAIARFQRDADLAADGVIGSRTLMTLYTRGPYPRPRLGGQS